MPPSSVVQEAALLVELLSSRSTWGGSPRQPARSDDADRAHAEQHHRNTRGADEPATGTAAPECTCGGRQPAACRVCPVCQVIAFMQRMSPETIERVADFAQFAATALREVADARRAPDESDTDEPGTDEPDTDEPRAGA